MAAEIANYKANLTAFVERLQKSFVYKIVFSVDRQPTFDLDIVPFNFRYSFSATLVTDRGNFKISPAMTSEGFETFWTKQLEQPEDNGEVENINSIIKAIHSETMKSFKLPFKMTIQFDQSELILYCAEIYGDKDDTLRYNAYDEMLLAFDNKQEAAKFEQLINYA
ncbi:hypothetical protein [Hymenobacter sp.]|jgi:hypothetical protein|uniref:hypothetical protein n=1 Tax=Hymenobacter sp. TaxID=1898978 RepID=UPI002ED915EB